MAAVRVAAVLAAVTRLVDRRQLADSAASADHQSVGCLAGQKPTVETPQSHDARVVFHPGEDQRLRIVVRRVHGGARSLSGGLAHGESGVQVAVFFLDPGTFQQLIRFQAQSLALVGTDRRVRSWNAGLPWNGPETILSSFGNLRQLKCSRILLFFSVNSKC